MQKNNNNNLEEPSTRHHGEMQIGIVKGPWLNCKNIGNYHKNIIAHLADQENQQRNANWFAKGCLYRLISNSTLWVLANLIKSFLQWVFLNFPMYVLLYMYVFVPPLLLLRIKQSTEIQHICKDFPSFICQEKSKLFMHLISVQ